MCNKHIVFAKGGVEYLIELPDAFSRACFFVPQFFCSLVPRKKHSLRLVAIELLVQFSPPFANTFSVVAKSAPLLSPQRFGGLHPLLVRAASRTSHNKQICKIPRTEANFLLGTSQIRRTVMCNFKQTCKSLIDTLNFIYEIYFLAL